MKYTFVFTVVIFILLNSSAQTPNTIKAKYLITRKYFQVNEQQQQKLVATQNLIGTFCKKGNEYFFSAVPSDTLSQQEIQLAENNYMLINFLRDSLQMVHYRNLDSLYNLVYIFRQGVGKLNKYDFFLGEQKWELLSQTKKIGAFNCQKAIYKDDGDIVAEIWFSTTIPVSFGLKNFNEIPGFIVEATEFYPYAEYKLIDYAADVPVNSNEILPAYMRTTPTYLSKEAYERAMKNLRILRKTQGRIN